MAYFTQVLAVFFFCSLNGVMSQFECTQDNYNRCIQGLLPYIQDGGNTFFRNYSSSALSQLCQAYDGVKSCIENFQHLCPRQDKAAIYSMHAQYDYICNKQRQGVIDFGTCLASPELHQRTLVCNTSFHAGIQTDILGNNCGHLKFYLDCIYDEVKMTCGDQAALWQRGYDEAIFQPILAATGCRLDMHPHTYCIVNNHNRCAEPMREHGLGEEWNIVANYPVPKMRAICESFREVKPCINTFIDNCLPATVSYYQGIYNTYTYVCDDHFEEYVRHSDCFQDPRVHQEGLVCNATFHYGLSSQLYINGTNEYKRARLCQHINNLVDCVENLVHSFCGAEAAEWQRGFEEVTYTPLFELINCSFTPNHNRGNTNNTDRVTSPGTGGVASPVIDSKGSPLLMWILIPIGILVLIIIALLLGVCLCWSKKSRRNAAQSQSPGQGPPEPAVVYNNFPPPHAGGEGAALPPDMILVPPPYTEKALTFEQLDNGYAFAPQPPPGADEVKVPLPPEYETLGEVQFAANGQAVDEDGYAKPEELSRHENVKNELVDDDKAGLVDDK